MACLNNAVNIWLEYKTDHYGYIIKKKDVYKNLFSLKIVKIFSQILFLLVIICRNVFNCNFLLIFLKNEFNLKKKI